MKLFLEVYFDLSEIFIASIYRFDLKKMVISSKYDISTFALVHHGFLINVAGLEIDRSFVGRPEGHRLTGRVQWIGCMGGQMAHKVPHWQVCCAHRIWEENSHQHRLQPAWPNTRQGPISQVWWSYPNWWPEMGWDQHITNTCDKANLMISFLRWNLNIGVPSVKERAYFTHVRPLVEYASTVWNLYTQTNIQKLEMVQWRAARYVKSRHRITSSVSDMLSTMNWRSLQDRRDARLCMLYKFDRNMVAIKKDMRLVSPKRRTQSLPVTKL